MKIKQSYSVRMMVLVCLMLNVIVLSSRMKADTGNCGGVTVTLPFTDVMGNLFFCQIAGAYFSGLTNGTSATTYSPAQTSHASRWRLSLRAPLINRSNVAVSELLRESGGRHRMQTA